MPLARVISPKQGYATAVKAEARSWSWQQLVMRLGQRVSKDPSRKVGCIIARGFEEVACGVNEFPRGVRDTEERMERPAKYQWTEHAERNAIFEAAYHGRPLAGATMYIPWYPCADCARAIIETGIAVVVVSQEPDLSDTVYGFAIARQMFREAGVTVHVVPGVVSVQERKP